ncbi:MAG: toll/interleukin-1 receptor domain-containing protein [Acidobacteriota bacterium]|nr:toll/interleukin-1 receptor domain-containing protein [Acidobacteriota bacterium]
MTKQEITNSIQDYKDRRDDLMHEDVNGFDHLVGRFLDFCENDSLLQIVMSPLKEKFEDESANQWWESGKQRYQIPDFPQDRDQELTLRYQILESIRENREKIFDFGEFCNTSKFDEATESFRSIVLRPLMKELSRRIAEVANLATPEAREVQAVPLIRIPSPKEIKIFLSHKNNNKDIVRRYYQALKDTGFDPWLDESNMAAGANLERELIRGFDESCAVVFFMTEHFTDENYLATEIEYAIEQKRKKGKKFAIITLRYPGANEVPRLLTRYIYKDIDNDLDGFREIIRGLPIELGLAVWKKEVVE